jgi:hypothetical protein
VGRRARPRPPKRFAAPRRRHVVLVVVLRPAEPLPQRRTVVNLAESVSVRRPQPRRLFFSQRRANWMLQMFS